MNFSFILLLLALAAMLLVAPFNPEAGNIAYLSLGGVALILAFPQLKEEWNRPIVWMPLSGFALVGLSYLVGHGSVDGLIGLLFFAPVLTIFPFVVAANRSPNTNWHLTWPAVLALGGAVMAFIMAYYDYTVTGSRRAGGNVANPIHFADVALLVGTIPLYVLILRKEKWRWLALLATCCGVGAVLFSGSRGAIIATPIMLLVGYLAAGVANVFPRRFVGLTSLAATVVLVLTVVLFGRHIGGLTRLLSDVERVMAQGIPPGSMNYERLQMIIGGWGAFLERPMFGHGPLNFQAAAERIGDIPKTPIPHLHNDIMDFLASGGIVGFVAFLLFMFAPLAEAWRAIKTSQGGAIFTYILMLMSGFFVMGLTNAMFGILTLTNYYAVICVLAAIFVGKATREVSPARR